MRAFLNLRGSVPARRDAFVSGLKRCGYYVIEALTAQPQDGDILVTWNRIYEGQNAALAFEARGLPVLVAENAAWGNDFAGGHWYTLARNFHNTSGCFPIGGNERWDALNVPLLKFCNRGETVILPQRGIGSPPVAMPRDWIKRARTKYSGRVRQHPGQSICVPLHNDLAACGQAVTWGSGAAIKALMMGVPVISEMPNWIGEQDNTDSGRLAMFRRLAWAQWRLKEFEDGTAFARILAG